MSKCKRKKAFRNQIARIERAVFEGILADKEREAKRCAKAERDAAVKRAKRRVAKEIAFGVCPPDHTGT